MVDTDIGSDLDDALAIAYLLARSDVDLLGITTATGQPDLRARLASVLCERAGRDIPIHSGNAKSLDGAHRQPDVPQACVLDRWPSRAAHSDDAPGFLAETILRHPHPVTLVCLAPLTNVALLAARYPDAFGRVGRVVVMGGNFTLRPGRPRREWNFAVDPEAARLVYRTRRTTTIGLDVTHDVSLQRRAIERLVEAAPRLAPLLDFADPHFAKYDEVYLHDVLAAAAAVGDDHCTFSEAVVDIADDGESGIADGGSIRHTIATSVAAEKFAAHVVDVLGS